MCFANGLLTDYFGMLISCVMAEQFVKLQSCGLLNTWGDVTVSVKGDGDSTVPQPLLNDLWVCPVFKH